MPVIGEYQARISPPSGRETVPANVGLAAAPAEAVAGIGGALTDFGSTVLSQISNAQDSVEFSKVQMQADQIHNALIDTLQTTWDDDVREQLYETATKDTAGILGTIRRPNVRNMFQRYLNDITPHRQAAFNTIDRRMKIDKMKADTQILDEYDYEHGNKENFRIRHERNRDNGLETPEETESLKQNFDVNSLLYRSRLDIGSNEPLRVNSAIENLEKARPLMSGPQLDEANSLLAAAKRQQSVVLKQIQQETSRNLLADLWENKLTDPNIVTIALRNGWLSDTDAKYLRNAILNPNPPETTSEALIAVRYAIDGIAEGTETRESALKKVVEYTQQLSPTDGKAFIKEIFGEHDTKNAFWNRQALEYMEKQIMDVASLTGILYGSGEQLALSAKALIAYDEAKKTAAAEGKPLKGRELLELAHEVMIPFRKQVKPLMPGEKLPETLGGRKISPEYKPPAMPEKPLKKIEEKESVVEKYPKPKTVNEFLNTFRHISDKEERKRYYDKWANEVYK